MVGLLDLLQGSDYDGRGEGQAARVAPAVVSIHVCGKRWGLPVIGWGGRRLGQLTDVRLAGPGHQVLGAGCGRVVGMELVGSNGVHSGAGMEPGHLVDDLGGGMSTYGWLPSVRRDGKDVGGPIQSADCHPATVGGKHYVLHLGEEGGKKSLNFISTEN